MRLTLPYPTETSELTGFVLPDNVRLAVIKTRQMFCRHQWNQIKKTNLFGDHFVQIDRCCKCKKRRTNSLL